MEDDVVADDVSDVAGDRHDDVSDVADDARLADEMRPSRASAAASGSAATNAPVQTWQAKHPLLLCM
jgi:hypothetical protein